MAEIGMIRENQPRITGAIVNRAYGEIRLTPKELLATILLAAGIIVLSLPQFKGTGPWLAVTLIITAIGFSTPFSSLVLLPIAVILPFPDGSPLKPADIIFFGFICLVVLTNGWRLQRPINQIFLFLPLLLYIGAFFSLDVLSPTGGEVTALYFAAMTIFLCQKFGSNDLKACVAIGIGCLFVGLPFWGRLAGLPIELSTWGGEREGYARLGSGRLDSVLVWPLALAGMFLLVSAFIACQNLYSRHDRLWLSVSYGFLPVIFGIPVILGTMTHGGIASLGIVTLAFTAWSLIFATGGRQRSGASTVSFIFSVAILTLIAFTLDILGLQSRILSLESFFLNQTEELGWAASRTSTWEDTWSLIEQYPILGAPEELRPTYAAHSAFLTYWSVSGVIGLLFFSVPLLIPSYWIWKYQTLKFAGPLLMGNLVWILFLATLSFAWFKPVWVFWAVTVYAAHAARMRRKGRRERRRTPVETTYSGPLVKWSKDLR